MLPSLDDIHMARDAISGVAIRTPLVRLNAPTGGPEIWLKLENLQPTGSFKLRGAAAALAGATAADVATGLVTASAGNMGQGAAWFAQRLGVPCTVLVPPTAPTAKIDAMEAYGARVLRVSADDWWTAFVQHRAEGIEGIFIHAFDDPRVMAGNATIALEIVEDLPDVTAVVAPWGGGGLTCGIAAGMAAVAPLADHPTSGRSTALSGRVQIYAAEIATAAPLVAALAAGSPVTVPFEASFVDGIGSRTVLPSMFERAAALGIESLVAPLDDVATALLTLLERNRVLAEGAGATPVACALAAAASGIFGKDDKVVCIVSGGVIGLSTLLRLMAARKE